MSEEWQEHGFVSKEAFENARERSQMEFGPASTVLAGEDYARLHSGADTADKVKRVQETLDDIALWEKKAVNRVKEGRSASVRFASEDIGENLTRMVEVGLDACESVEDVRELFRLVRSQIGKIER